MKTIFILIGVALVYYFFFNTKSWSGWVYPDKNDLTYSKSIGNYDSLKECRSSALDMLRSYPNGDYECGLDCNHDNTLGISVCEETVR